MRAVTFIGPRGLAVANSCQAIAKKNMPLYTFILDYKGGTYIDQVEALSPHAAQVAWAAARTLGEIPGMGEASIRELRAGMEEVAVPLAGLVNAWCTTALVRGRVALVNFVETAVPQATPQQL